MILTLALSLLPQFTAAPQPVAPYGLPNSGSVAAQRKSNGGPAVIEDFEAYAIGAGGAENISTLTLDSTTITGTGQGPGLVLPGVLFQCIAGSLQWNGDTYFGLPSKTFLANSGDSTLFCSYATPQASVSFGLHAFSGFPDTAIVDAYDSLGTLVDTTGPVNVPGPTTVPVTLTGPDIQRVVITGIYSWSPIIDDNEFDTGTLCGLQLSIIGPCPGMNNVTVSGGVPGNLCFLGYATALGAYTVPGGPCAGTVLGLDASVTLVPGSPFVFDASGQVLFSAFVPAGACGAIYVQAMEDPSCCISNIVAL
jgi:hypothetical protein